jgi:hypothetical protein
VQKPLFVPFKTIQTSAFFLPFHPFFRQNRLNLSKIQVSESDSSFFIGDSIKTKRALYNY